MIVSGHTKIVMSAVILFVSAAAFASRDPAAVISRARTLPAKDAVRVMDSLSKVKDVPGVIKAQTLKFLGDHRFIKEDYKKAADLYQQASMLDNGSAYRLLYALSAAQSGDHARAAEILRAIAEVSADPVGGEAARILALLEVGSSISNSPDQQVATVNSQNAAFTIQVGAFGSRENAESLVKRLSATYKDVTILPTTTGEATLYRVRVGAFNSREEASALADKLITEGGMSARVVEK